MQAAAVAALGPFVNEYTDVAVWTIDDPTSLVHRYAETGGVGSTATALFILRLASRPWADVRYLGPLTGPHDGRPLHALPAALAAIGPEFRQRHQRSIVDALTALATSTVQLVHALVDARKSV